MRLQKFPAEAEVSDLLPMHSHEVDAKALSSRPLGGTIIVLKDPLGAEGHNSEAVCLMQRGRA